jgi:uncharacterized repeat protein (TIGR03806 family)
VVGKSKAAVMVGFLGVLLLSMMGSVTRGPGAMGAYLNGVFPDITPGFGGAWYLENRLPEIDILAPLKILELPGSEEVLILCKTGQLWRVNLEEQTQDLVLDITDRTINYSEAGAISIALHPEFGNPDFPSKQLAFIFYRYKPDPEVHDHPGYNRLSKFRWDENAQQFDESSEEILIQQYDRSAWHNGGGLFFHEGLLYLALGDEGEPDHRPESNQTLERGLFSGLLRIDVDNDPTRSHPIRRQPIANAAPPEGWPQETYTQGYMIPNDNPWLSEDGNLLEEFYAIGIRSPYSTHFDPVKNTIWLSDVGSSKREEINQVEKGDNLQWNFLEGEDWAGGRPEEIIGNEKVPLFHYGNDLGNCIIGAGVYRGSEFIYLNGRYLFADYVRDNIMALRMNVNSEPEAEVLLTDFGPEPVDVPQFSSISGMHYLSSGEILITTIAWPFREGGRILHLRQREAIPDPPAKLSELGVFTNMATLEVAEGIIPYQVNAPLWSDRAIKRRWMAIPNDGEFNQASEQIKFSEEEDWKFPEGTVFIKHFDLPTSQTNPAERVKLETRFFIMAKNNTAYGLTYKWNEDQTEAFLQLDNSSETYDIYDEGLAVANQKWDFPSRDQCMSCHNSNANFVLGVKTHQLNSEMFYPSLGVSQNQLQYLSDHNIIDHNDNEWSDYPRAYDLNDFVSLDLKIRSYLDANCSSCHRLGGISGVTMDLRFHTPLESKNIIELPTLSQTSSHDYLIVEPGNHALSELWIRDQSRGDDQMPPLGTNMVDQEYVDALAEWIDGMGEEEAADIEDFITFPNPSNGWMVVRANPTWQLPLRVNVYSADGKLAHTEEHQEHTVHLGLQRVGAGAFLLNVQDAAGNSHTERIVIR